MGGVETVRGEAETRRAANVAFPQTTRRSRSSPQSRTVHVRSGRHPSSSYGSRRRPGRCWPADQRPGGGTGARSSPQSRAPASPTRLQPQTRHWTRSTATCACQHGAVPTPQPLFRSRCVTTSSQRCQASGCSADRGRLHRPAAAGTAQAWKKRGTRRRAAHRGSASRHEAAQARQATAHGARIDPQRPRHLSHPVPGSQELRQAARRLVQPGQELAGS